MAKQGGRGTGKHPHKSSKEPFPQAKEKGKQEKASKSLQGIAR